ncbi:MAG: hypothetical protein K8J31_12885, partial [Anaerolineae bacterium]|nr:hypothetical protein [Anaerolineae bacterium]
MTVIDTHQHRWDLGKFEYRWIQPGSILARNYLTDEALRAMQSGAVDLCVLVEAGTNRAEELDWFLDMAHQHAHVAGVVGYIDLTGDVPAALAAIHPDHRRHLKGVRIGIMDPAADLAALEPGLSVLALQHLTCDLLIRR